MKTKKINPNKSDFAPADPIERVEISLDDSQEQKLIQWVDDGISAIKADRTDFLNRHKKYLYNWDDFVTFNRKGPWENSSQLHMPLTAIKVRSYLSRLYNIFTSEDTTQLIPRETFDERHVDMVKKLRAWYLWDYLNGYKGIRGFAREVFYDTVTVGFGVGLKDWQVILRKFINVEANELQREMADLGGEISKANGEMMQTGEEMERSSVSIKPYKEVQKVVAIFEGTRLQSVPVENSYFPNFIPESCDLDFPQIVGIVSEFSLSEIMLKGERGEWNKDKVEKVKELNQTHGASEAQEIRQHRERLSGVDDTSIRAHLSKRMIERVFCSYDIDEDGIDEELVVTKCEKVILKVDFLDRISPSGMRPLFKFDCFSKPRQAYSRGVPEYLFPLNEEMDQHHNMRIDYLALQTCPFGVYRAASSLKNEPIQIAPGKFIPVDDTTDMRVLNFATNATTLSSEEDRLWHYSDMLSASSSLNQGIVPQQVGPTRSTSGVVTMLRQMDKEFIVTVDQCAQQWKKMEKMIMDDLDFRVSPAIKMRVLGASLEESLSANPQMTIPLMVNAQFDMAIDVARAVTSDEVQKNDAEMILNKLAAPSIATQMGIIGPKALMTAYTKWLKAWGEEPGLYLTKPKLIEEPLNLYQEIQIIGQGEVPPMAMQDDHMQKAQMLQAFLQSPEFAEAQEKGLYPQNMQELTIKAAQKHMVLAEMLQPQNMPNPTGQNGANMTETMTGTSPQQGGPNPNQTTSRELAQPSAQPSENAPSPEA